MVNKGNVTSSNVTHIEIVYEKTYTITFTPPSLVLTNYNTLKHPVFSKKNYITV